MAVPGIVAEAVALTNVQLNTVRLRDADGAYALLFEAVNIRSRLSCRL